MKKVLFATTALVASAGVAAAQDITFSGGAAAGIFYDDVNDVTDMYNSLNLEATFAGSTDNGLTFGATMDVTAGTDLDIGEVGTAEFDTPGAVNDDEDGTFGLGTIFISGNFGTLTFARDDIDNLYDDDFSHDLMYEYDVAGIGVALTYNVNAPAGDSEDWSLMLSYDGNAAGTMPLSAFLETDDSNEFHIGLGYSITPEFSAGLEHESDGEITTLSGVYDNGMFSASAEVNTDDEWEIGLGYTDQGYTVNASTDQDDEWELTGEYDLGGGLSLVAGTAHTNNMYLGAAMSF